MTLVKTAHHNTASPKTFRGPTLSATRPAGAWNSAYPSTKAPLKTQPSVNMLLRRNSWAMACPATRYIYTVQIGDRTDCEESQKTNSQRSLPGLGSSGLTGNTPNLLLISVFAVCLLQPEIFLARTVNTALKGQETFTGGHYAFRDFIVKPNFTPGRRTSLRHILNS